MSGQTVSECGVLLTEGGNELLEMLGIDAVVIKLAVHVCGRPRKLDRSSLAAPPCCCFCFLVILGTELELVIALNVEISIEEENSNP